MAALFFTPANKLVMNKELYKNIKPLPKRLPRCRIYYLEDRIKSEPKFFEKYIKMLYVKEHMYAIRASAKPHVLFWHELVEEIFPGHDFRTSPEYKRYYNRDGSIIVDVGDYA